MATRNSRKRGPYVDPDVMTEIERLVDAGRSPTPIKKELDNQDRFNGRVPILRTIQRIVKDLVPTAPSEHWTLTDSDPESARIVLDVLAVIIKASDGKIYSISRDQAHWVGCIWRVAPDLKPDEVRLLARAYQRASERKLPVHDLDWFLGLAPWRSEEALDTWRSERFLAARRYSLDNVTYVATEPERILLERLAVYEEPFERDKRRLEESIKQIRAEKSAHSIRLSAEEALRRLQDEGGSPPRIALNPWHEKLVTDWVERKQAERAEFIAERAEFIERNTNGDASE